MVILISANLICRKQILYLEPSNSSTGFIRDEIEENQIKYRNIIFKFVPRIFLCETLNSRQM